MHSAVGDFLVVGGTYASLVRTFVSSSISWNDEATNFDFPFAMKVEAFLGDKVLMEDE